MFGTSNSKCTGEVPRNGSRCRQSAVFEFPALGCETVPRAVWGKAPAPAPFSVARRSSQRKSPESPATCLGRMGRRPLVAVAIVAQSKLGENVARKLSLCGEICSKFARGDNVDLTSREAKHLLQNKTKYADLKYMCFIVNPGGSQI